MIKNLFTAFASTKAGNHLSNYFRVWVFLLSTILLASQAMGQTKEWDKTYGGAENDELEIVRHTSDGGYIMGGTSYSGISGDKTKASRGGADFWVVKVDAAGAIEWNKVYGGDGDDRLAAMEPTNDGGYILGGYSISGKNGNKSDPSRGGYDYWVVKINAKGKVQWDQTVGGSSSDLLSDLIQTSDGGYLLGGESISAVSGDKTEASRGGYDYWIIKLSSKGKQQWDRTYGGALSDLLNSLLQTSDGGFLLGGGSDSYVSGDKTSPQKVFCDDECYFNFWVVKVDATGNWEWDKTFGATGGETGQSILDMAPTQDGGYLLAGNSDSDAKYDKSEPNKSTFGDYNDFWVVKINATGDIQWDRTLGADGNESLGAVLATPDGGFLLGGRSNSEVSDDKTEPRRDEDINAGDYWIVKLDAMGSKLWDKTFGGTGNDDLESLDLTMDGGYILGGKSDSPISGDKTEGNVGGFDYWIVKMTGETCVTPTPSIALTPSSHTYTGGIPTNMYLGYGPTSMTITASGGTTYMWSPAMGLSSTNTAETVFTPTEAGVYTFTVTAWNGECMASASVTITVMDIRCGSKLTKVMICHKGQVICIADDAAKAHLKNHPEDRLGACETEEMPTATTAASVQVYPNPFTSATAIQLSFQEDQEYTVEVYDGNGKMIKRWATTSVKAGEQVKLEWAPKKGERGLYVVKIITRDGVQNRQILKQ
ncbi:T9SS type A sorting domain-containing protein [Nibribacter ruber]|uniref:T9SS type A sorting domain-containing protein n=1 Tax=Nibribacter ruber TaxID=2698458 RepID=A0A6P1NSF8_9BACT|nr:T9SS type A sorting domain-containing protein [Nibribacter ruber]QHL86617.1 T9SS type A sorting domain-containing protein [Nibribacter ruber]